MEEVKIIMPNRKAVAYYRVSSEEQRRKESIELQKTTLHQLAEEESIDIISQFQDDGVSGEEISRRAGFQKCLEYILTGEADLLLVYMVDRIGRFKKRRDRNQVIETLEESHTSVMDSDKDLWRWDNEKEMNNLEIELNEARQDNIKRAKRVKAGHRRVREAGGFSGGRTPFGIKYTKERGFEIVPHQIEALKVIFSKFLNGWGTKRIVNFLNLNRQQFRPDGYKKHGKESVWTASRIEHLVDNDFYFTGMIYPKTYSKKDEKRKDLPMSVDTGIKLFPKEMIKAVRRERSKRVYQKRGDDKVVHIDQYPMLGLARCGGCRCRLGLWSDRRTPGKIRRYYICHTKKEGCIGWIRTITLDGKVWNAFRQIKTESLQETILQTSYILDIDAVNLESKLATIESDLEKIEGETHRLIQVFQKGYVTEDELDSRMSGVLERKADLEEEKDKCEKALYCRQDVEDSVDKAVNYLQDQIDLVDTFERYPDDVEVQEKVKEALGILDEVYLAGTEIKDLVNRLKRRVMQQFIDPEKGIQVFSKDKIVIHGVTGEALEYPISNKSF